MFDSAASSASEDRSQSECDESQQKSDRESQKESDGKDDEDFDEDKQLQNLPPAKSRNHVSYGLRSKNGTYGSKTKKR